MKTSGLLLIVGILVLALTVAAFVTVRADASPAAAFQVTTATPTETPTAFPPPSESGSATPTALTPVQDASLAVLWDKLCVKKVPYTILAIPSTASFGLVAADGSVVPSIGPGNNPHNSTCKSVLRIGDQLILVCTGRENTSFTLRVTDAGLSQDFSIPLLACPMKPPQAGDTPTPLPSPAMEITPSLTPTALP
jgi:hypothetical protein